MPFVCMSKAPCMVPHFTSSVVALSTLVFSFVKAFQEVIRLETGSPPNQECKNKAWGVPFYYAILVFEDTMEYIVIA